MTVVTGWVGCYTSAKEADHDGGIGRLHWDTTSGEMTVSLAACEPDPSWLVLAPDGRTLHAVMELDDGRVQSYVVDDGRLQPLGSVATRGGSPCHLALADGRILLAANYGTGSVTAHPLDAIGAALRPTSRVVHDGPVGPVAGRQEAPHAHQVVPAPDGQHVFACDLGLDVVIGYRLDPDGPTLTEVSRTPLPPGTGPRHLAFHPRGHAAYVVGELANTLTTCRVEDGALEPVHTAGLRPDGDEGEAYAAAVVVDPDGKRVRVTVRGDDTVVTLALNGGGLLARVLATTPSGGAWPRDLTRTTDGHHWLVADERAGAVVGFTLDGDTLRETARAPWSSATCVVLDPTTP